MAYKPILFNTEMVRAILDGMKTQTRRICKITSDSDPEPYNHSFCADVEFPATNYKGPCANFVDKSGHFIGAAKQHIQVGDVLWVRETWQRLSDFGEQLYVYRADYKDDEPLRLDGLYTTWRPSIHMPREAARIFLKVKDVRAEQLQSITMDEIRAEGLTSAAVHAWDEEIAFKEWGLLWNSTIKPDDLPRYGWDANPWVWVYEFELCDKPDDF